MFRNTVYYRHTELEIIARDLPPFASEDHLLTACGQRAIEGMKAREGHGFGYECKRDGRGVNVIVYDVPLEPQANVG